MIQIEIKDVECWCRDSNNQKLSSNAFLCSLDGEEMLLHHPKQIIDEVVNEIKKRFPGHDL